MCKIIGIDVSKHNGIINWKTVKNSSMDIDFAIIRAGYGSSPKQKDEKFETNYLGAKQNGIPCGAYWYCYAKNAAEALNEAKAFIEVAKGKQFDLPVFYDIEEKESFPKAAEIAEAFCSYLESKGYYVGVYCSSSHVKTHMPGITARYAGWIADWTKKPGNIPWIVWQYSSKGRVEGISGNVDLDAFVSEDEFHNVQTTIYQNGMNGYPKQYTTTVTVDPSKDTNIEKAICNILDTLEKMDTELKQACDTLKRLIS